MGMCRQKRDKVFSKIIALVIMQTVVLFGLQSAYCGESLRQKTGNLSPQINVGTVELQQAFNITATVFSDSVKVDKRISRRKFIKFFAIVITALVVLPPLATKSLADNLTKGERKRFEEIRNRLRASEAAKEVQASYKLSKVDE